MLPLKSRFTLRSGQQLSAKRMFSLVALSCVLGCNRMYTNEVFVLFSRFGEMHLGMLLSLGIKQALNCFTAQSAYPSVPRGVRQHQGTLYLLAETLG